MKKSVSSATILFGLSLLALLLAAECARASFGKNNEKPFYSVDGNTYGGEHELLMYLLSHPAHGDITMHQCVVLTEELKFKKCTLTSRHL